MPGLKLTINKEEVILEAWLNQGLVLIIRLQLERKRVFDVLTIRKTHWKVKKTD